MKNNLLFVALALLAGCGSAAPKVEVAAAEDETLVYSDADGELTLKAGDKHPTQEGWKFYTAHEFNGKDTDNTGTPLGFEPQNKWFHTYADINNDLCATVEDGILHLRTIKHQDSIVNSFGNKVIYSTYSIQGVTPQHDDFWGGLSENMRFEVRMKCSDEVGFNHALWFMPEKSRSAKQGGAEYKGWPACGEIDLMETPRPEKNNTTWFTLHSENFYAGSDNGSTYATLDLQDMSQWHIYWVELTPNSMKGGVNGDCFFERVRDSNGNLDWPWDKDFWYFIMTPGISISPDSWMGVIDPDSWNESVPPYMQVDWLRIYVNDDFREMEAPKQHYY